LSAALAGRYRVERVLGEGGMARVDLARDVELDRLVAVKVLADHLADDPELRARFVREGRLAARLSHPHVVGVLNAGEEDGRPYIVMEYVDGGTLADVIRRDGALAWRSAVELACQALEGLEHAHRAGLVHRDVKPGNLLLRRDGQLKIGDFGIARAAETSGLTQAGTILGTAPYLAPEQARGEEVGPASDVYGLAAVLYELLTGRPPRQVSSLAELETSSQEPIPAVRDLAPAVPARVEDAVMRGLAADPAHRPSAVELRAELEDAEEPTTMVQPATARTEVQPPRREPRRRRRAPWLVAAVAALAVLGAAAFALAADDDPTPPPPPAAEPTPAPQQQGPQAGATPDETARKLSEWLRANTRAADR